MSYCAYQERCRQEIVGKLAEWEATDEQISTILDRLEVERFWDEGRFAAAFAGGKFRVKKWGRMKIRQELRQKGISDDLIESAFRQEIPHFDYQKTLEDLAQKKLKQLSDGASVRRYAKLYRYLTQKGYEPHLVKKYWAEVT